MKMGTPIWVAAIIAVIAWAFSAWIPPVVAIAAIVTYLGAFARPVFLSREKKPDGTTKWEWTWKDWIGLAVIIIVVVALFKGVEPEKLLKLIPELWGG